MAAARRRYPNAPPLEPLVELSARIGTPPWNYNLTAPNDPQRRLAELIASPLASDLGERTHGHFDDVVTVHRNLAVASHVLNAMTRDLVQHAAALERRPDLRRLVVSQRLVHDAMLYADAALVLHLRTETKSKPALALCRGALETAARGGWVALGTEDEPDRYHQAPFITERDERKATEVRPGDCLERIRAVVEQRWPDADSPGTVYRWLCAFTHHDARAVLNEPTTVDVYAAIAYATTVAGLMAEVLLGQDRIVDLPRMPDDLPWQRALVPPVPL